MMRLKKLTIDFLFHIAYEYYKIFPKQYGPSGFFVAGISVGFYINVIWNLLNYRKAYDKYNMVIFLFSMLVSIMILFYLLYSKKFNKYIIKMETTNFRNKLTIHKFIAYFLLAFLFYKIFVSS